MMATMTRLAMMVLLGAVLMTTVFADDDDTDFHFYNKYESVMPGVVRKPVSHHRWERTPPPPSDSAILFPGSNEGGGDNLWKPSVGFGTPAPAPVPDEVLELPSDINELDVGSLFRLNSISNISDFIELFDLALPKTPEPEASDFLGLRVGGSSTDEGETLPMANCKPELVTVPLDLPKEANTMFFPTCIRLEQCGGCCYGPLLTCRPSVTKVVKVKVLKVNAARSSSRGGRRRRRRQNPSAYHTAEAVKHTACECGCIVREEDCNSDLHTYFEGECSCVCKNKDEKAKCEKQNSTKYWDNDTCNCFCRKPLECGSGEYFSQTSCSCEPLTARSGISFGSEDAWEIATPTRRRRRKPVRVPLK